MSSEAARLSRLVSEFADEMREKLWKKLAQGYRGWEDDSDSHLVELLREKLRVHVDRYLARDPKQLVDIANLAAMLWRIEVQLRQREPAAPAISGERRGT